MGRLRREKGWWHLEDLLFLWGSSHTWESPRQLYLPRVVSVALPDGAGCREAKALGNLQSSAVSPAPVPRPGPIPPWPWREDSHPLPPPCIQL